MSLELASTSTSAITPDCTHSNMTPKRHATKGSTQSRSWSPSCKDDKTRTGRAMGQ
eukprot:CAMPEP_0175921620 /NCGR_PEP_ID=MMETSP0108-20121206/13575_1 /TAXON_ID=195067 ORGANISM="Goniomonas pacifica, Strain CCMP1869" /NCGR_SAMPLE_ID=MMETSP0108 /ASSEMBLY_ACC=CAM_ASM_000204 /LENGTH=55 /DNA_ID=CAMNT_0017244447 /DNA_START=176 /DNA_END=343 /DNA_ORIENTATION=-